MMINFFQGLLVGLGASIPLGPIGVLCVQRTLSKGWLSGFISGLGAAFTDTFFAALVVMGLAYIQGVIETHERYFLCFGGLLVVYIGLRIYLTNPIKQIRQSQFRKRRLEDFTSVIVLTLFNPGAFFLILALFALVGLKINSSAGSFAISTVLWGVFAGAGLWWYSLSMGISLFRNKFRLRQLLMINRISGIAIMVFGMISTLKGVWAFIFPFLKTYLPA
ncbi:MAG: LysE family transporter [Prevotellaceae bacterium]|nr:LysE family transporter [Prevotellaceae bacterium]